MESVENQVAELESRVAALEAHVVQLSELVSRLQPAGQGKLTATGKSASFGSKVGAAGDGGPDSDPELLDLIARNRKIAAIKRYRELTGAGLREAKAAVDALAAR